MLHRVDLLGELFRELEIRILVLCLKKWHFTFIRTLDHFSNDGSSFKAINTPFLNYVIFRLNNGMKRFGLDWRGSCKFWYWCGCYADKGRPLELCIISNYSR